MQVKTTKIKPYPGYESHVAMNLVTDDGGRVSMTELQESIKAYHLGEGTVMKDITIPAEGGHSLRLHCIIPANLPANAPVVLDIHGGGWVSGSVEIDNYRCIELAENTPCIVASVEYRLCTPELPFPAQLMDCRDAYLWLRENAGQLGGDASRIALHGTSAGGNLAAGLALYLRDHGMAQPALTVLNCPALSMEMTNSKMQFGLLGDNSTYSGSVECIYTSAESGAVSYYAMPGNCKNLLGLGSHMVVVGEYDPLRDEGLAYALQLLHDKVPCEIISAPRVTHGFCVLDKPLTRWVHHGICASLRREFGMEIVDF